MDLTIDNHLDAAYYNSPFLVTDQKRGRSATASGKLLYTASPDWRTQFEQVVCQQAQFGWNNGAHSVTINMQGNNLLDTLSDDLQPGKQFEQTVGWEYQRDVNLGDLTVTVV
jgi:hypothetical protein